MKMSELLPVKVCPFTLNNAQSEEVAHPHKSDILDLHCNFVLSSL